MNYSVDPRKQPTVTPRELARRMNKHHATIKRWAAAGRGPRWLRLPSGRLVCSEEEVDRWLASCALNGGGAADADLVAA